VGKKKKTGHVKKSSKGTKYFFRVIGSAAVVVAILVLSGNAPVNGEGPGKKQGKSFTVNGGETRPVLDPSQFTGQARSAYEAAKKYPEVLNQVFCYCYCNAPPFHHKSLLSCFTDRHGAG
jgi:hypothetical protein